ncbi:acid phosphatase family membrane protein YuiD [Polynucleobacter sphagniphilus]|uniref:divergent PAP2 family protein n=1 Tax=Polynucleobacter sphagniphilus TaxID=1743169 RepID=UPI0024734EF1|nr:divergent PAP2 family protein [Polynucleobacter sphagniphilus]MDH6240316.1 acid phosphatase family membrane protein YuiD [Polynucleobacter sphagniphilus]
MKYFSYLLTPFLAWLIAGILKFLINSLRARRFAFDLIGYGGLPSNHSAIVSSMATLIGLNEGIQNPAFGVAVALAFIVILDASSLRRQVGKHAIAINKLNNLTNQNPSFLRERMGHTRVEIFAGVLVGYVVGYLVGSLS